jgi:hypothetical protein
MNMDDRQPPSDFRESNQQPPSDFGASNQPPSDSGSQALPVSSIQTQGDSGTQGSQGSQALSNQSQTQPKDPTQQNAECKKKKAAECDKDFPLPPGPFDFLLNAMGLGPKKENTTTVGGKKRKSKSKKSLKK